MQAPPPPLFPLPPPLAPSEEAASLGEAQACSLIRVDADTATEFIEDLYHLAINLNVRTIEFTLLLGKTQGQDFAVKFSKTVAGIFPMEEWTPYLPSLKCTKPQALFTKLQSYGFARVDPEADQGGGSRPRKRRKTQDEAMIFYHRLFQPGRIDQLSKIWLVAPKLRQTILPAETHADDVTLSRESQLRARILDLERSAWDAKRREASLIERVREKDCLILDLRRRLELTTMRTTTQGGPVQTSSPTQEILATPPACSVCPVKEARKKSSSESSGDPAEVQEFLQSLPADDFDLLMEDLLQLDGSTRTSHQTE